MFPQKTKRPSIEYVPRVFHGLQKTKWLFFKYQVVFSQNIRRSSYKITGCLPLEDLVIFLQFRIPGGLSIEDQMMFLLQNTKILAIENNYDLLPHKVFQQKIICHSIQDQRSSFRTLFFLYKKAIWTPYRSLFYRRRFYELFFVGDPKGL